MKSHPNLISIALIGGGAVGFAVTSKPLLANREADVPLNVLGINRSPYGEVFAMAMQEPIEKYFHATEGGGAPSCDGSGACRHEQHQKGGQTAKNGPSGFSDRVGSFIKGMAYGLTERTNPYAASAAHKFYLRRGIEDKLRFAYNLDPGHYGNYNAYHFFLTEPQLGTRPELTPMAARLADETIAYCLSRNDDPRLALTAAAASANVIQLMFNDRDIHPHNPRFSIGDMKRMMSVSDRAMRKFGEISNQWTDDGLWGNLSGMRLMEIGERMRFVMKVRESQAQAIAFLSMTPFDYGVDNPAQKWRKVGNHMRDPFSYGTTPQSERIDSKKGDSRYPEGSMNGAGASAMDATNHI